MKHTAADAASPLGERLSRDHVRDLEHADYRCAAERHELSEQIARLLISYRSECKLTQKQLGERLGTTESGVSRLESGQHTPNLQTLSRILRILGKRIEFVNVPAAKPRRAALRGRKPTAGF